MTTLGSAISPRRPTGRCLSCASPREVSALSHWGATQTKHLQESTAKALAASGIPFQKLCRTVGEVGKLVPVEVILKEFTVERLLSPRRWLFVLLADVLRSLE